MFTAQRGACAALRCNIFLGWSWSWSTTLRSFRSFEISSLSAHHHATTHCAIIVPEDGRSDYFHGWGPKCGTYFAKGNKDFECRDSLDSIAFSIFVDILVELTNAVSEAKVQIFLLIVTTRCLGQRSRLPPRNSVESSHEVKKRRPAQPPLMRDTTWSLTVSLASQNFSRI